MEDIIALGSEFEGEDLRYRASFAFPCWRLHTGVATRELIALTLYTWGPAYAQKNQRSASIYGHAALVFERASPWCALLDGHPMAERLNPTVEENLEALTQLFLALCKSLKPATAKVLTDAGDYLPYNAHMSYFRSPRDVVSDLETIARFCSTGLPEAGIPAMDMATTMSFSTWRSPDQRQGLKAALTRLGPFLSSVRPQDIEIAWTSERFDHHELREGRAFLDYPHFLNAYLDGFYLDVLESAAKA